MSKSLTRERLMELFIYNPITGIFVNKSSRGAAAAGQRAGAKTGHGYRRIVIDKIKHYEHHLAWFYIHGEYPNRIDHTDGNRANNSIDNLRKATHIQNCWNSDRGSVIKGAYFSKRSVKWYSQIVVNGQVNWLGTFDSAEEAGDAYRSAADQFHGDFASHKRILERSFA